MIIFSIYGKFQVLLKILLTVQHTAKPNLMLNVILHFGDSEYVNINCLHFLDRVEYNRKEYKLSKWKGFILCKFYIAHYMI